MNIKKIIREEMDDFDWAKDVDILSHHYLKGKAIEFDPPINDYDYLNKVVDTLVSLDFILPEDVSQAKSYDLFSDSSLVGLFMDTNGVVWTNNHIEEETYGEHIANYLGASVEVLNGRELFLG